MITLELHRWDADSRSLHVLDTRDPGMYVQVFQSTSLADGTPDKPTISLAGFGALTVGKAKIYVLVINAAIIAAEMMETMKAWERFVLPEGYDREKRGWAKVTLTEHGPELCDTKLIVFNGRAI